VGSKVGTKVGSREGRSLGISVGSAVGSNVGSADGSCVGSIEGRVEDGFQVILNAGRLVGKEVVGIVVGELNDTRDVGLKVGDLDTLIGKPFGTAEGVLLVGIPGSFGNEGVADDKTVGRKVGGGLGFLVGGVANRKRG